jgi:hypothetical protein
MTKIRHRIVRRSMRHPLLTLYFRPGRKRFPDAHARNLPGHYRALNRRRAKNKVAKQARKANR